MEAVEPAMPEGVQAGLGQLAADHIAERTVERREHLRVVLEGEGQQRQGARWRDAAQGRPGEIEVERAFLHIGEHLRVGPEPAFREHLEAERTVGTMPDRLGHFSKAARSRAVRRLVGAEPVVEAGIWHGPMITGCAGRKKLLILLPAQGGLARRGGMARARRRSQGLPDLRRAQPRKTSQLWRIRFRSRCAQPLGAVARA
jgi:hypothetical protein